MSESPEGFEVQAGDKKIKLWGDNIIQILQLVTLVALTVLLFKHDSEAAKSDDNVVQAIKDNTRVQREQLNAQREANCLNRLTPEQKKQQEQIDFCRSLGKGQ